MFELNDELMPTDAALQRVRDQSITLGISANSALLGNDTPPPSPADFANPERNPMDSHHINAHSQPTAQTATTAPTATAERNDLTALETELDNGKSFRCVN